MDVALIDAWQSAKGRLDADGGHTHLAPGSLPCGGNGMRHSRPAASTTAHTTSSKHIVARFDQLQGGQSGRLGSLGLPVLTKATKLD